MAAVSVKRSIGFMSKKSSARASRFLVHFFDVHCTATTTSNATFHGGRERTSTNFPFPFCTWKKSLRIQLQGNCPNLTN